MKHLLIALLFIAVSLSCVDNKKVTTVDFRSSWDTTRVLENPHKGWYQHVLDNQTEKYRVKDMALFKSFPGMDHLYIRIAWSFLEPEEGHYDWHLIDEIVNDFVPEGYGISFAISSKETGKYPVSAGQEKNGVQYATPIWVEEAGAKGVVSESGRIKSWSPAWNDPVYLEKLDTFQKAFAQRYDGKPWVRYIDIRSIGDWGEGHTSFSTKIPPTVAEVKDNMNIFLKHFKKTMLVVTDDLLYYGKPDNESSELYQYAVSNGMTLRDDSPMVDWYMEQDLNTWSVSHPQFFDPLYKTKPIVFELQHYSAVKKDGNWIGKNGEGIIPAYAYSGADIMKNAIKTIHATYIGFHGYAEEWLTDNPDLSKELTNMCGYWYFPVQASFSSVMKTGGNMLSVTWLNKGVAPAYFPYSLVLQLRNRDTDENMEIQIQDSGNRKWLPDSEYLENYTFDLPETLSPGMYSLGMKLLYADQGSNRTIEVGIEEDKIKDSFIQLGEFRLP